MFVILEKYFWGYKVLCVVASVLTEIYFEQYREMQYI